MANPIFDNKELGKYPRRYDAVSEDSDKDADKAIIADVLRWMEINVDTQRDKAKEPKDIAEMIDVGVVLSRLNSKVTAISQLQSSPINSHVRKGANKLLYDVYYGVRNLFSRRKIKSTLTILGGIGVGVAIGVVLGTLVFPGIGSAIGGAVGAFITGTTAALGGGIGFGILGGLVGRWFGKKIADKVFKDEKHYELSKKITSKIKKQYGISGRTLQLMNAYLYNRQHAVQSPLCQRYYKMLRKNGIQKGDNVAIEKLAHYFLHELSLLNLELTKTVDNESLLEDRRAVLYILKKLKKSEHLSYKTILLLTEGLKQVNKKEDLPPARMVFNKEAEVKASITAEPETSARFVENLRNAGIGDTKVTAEKHRPESVNHSYYKYHIERENQTTLPEVLYREVKVSGSHYSAEVLVDKAQLNDTNREDVSKVLVAHAKAIYASSGNRYLKVLSGGDDGLAVQLMAAALLAEMKPDLDEQEYPLDTLEQQQKRSDLEKEAYLLAKLPPPVKVGFRLEVKP